MIYSNLQKHIRSNVYKEWAEAYLDLQEDEMVKQYIVSLGRDEAGRQVLEQSRQIWFEHGLPAPFEFILSESNSA